MSIQAESFEHMSQGQRVDAALEMAAKKFNCQPWELQWSSWLHTFGSTSGPRGGLAGQAFTTFRVFGFTAPDGTSKQYCAGIWQDWDMACGGWGA